MLHVESQKRFKIRPFLLFLCGICNKILQFRIKNGCSNIIIKKSMDLPCVTIFSLLLTQQDPCPYQTYRYVAQNYEFSLKYEIFYVFLCQN